MYSRGSCSPGAAGKEILKNLEGGINQPGLDFCQLLQVGPEVRYFVGMIRFDQLPMRLADGFKSGGFVQVQDREGSFDFRWQPVAGTLQGSGIPGRTAVVRHWNDQEDGTCGGCLDIPVADN